MKIRFPDIAGGFVAALIGLPQSIVLGIVVFAPLGTSAGIELGIHAGLVAAIAGGAVASFCGGAPLLISGPRATASLILASLVTELAARLPASGGGLPENLLAWVFLCVLLSGLFQAVLGGLHADRIIRRIPEPVAANFTLAIGAIIVLDQLRPLLSGAFGKRPMFSQIPLLFGEALQHPGALIVGGSSLAVIMALTLIPGLRESKLWRGAHAPAAASLAPLIGLTVGMLLYILVQHLGVSGTGKVLGDIAGHLSQAGFLPHAGWLVPDWNADFLVLVLIHALLLTLMGSLDTMITASNLEVRFDAPFNARRTVISQGIANMVSAALGGIALVGSLPRSLPSAELGAKTDKAGVISAAFLLFMVTVLWPAASQLPLPLLASILTAIGIKMVTDNFAPGTDLQALRDGRGANVDTVTSLLTTLVMLMPVLFFKATLIQVTVAGVMVSIFGLLYKLSQKVVFNAYPIGNRRSMESRSAENRERLSGSSANGKVIELEGDIFFGTAIDLREKIEAEFPADMSIKGTHLVLDFSRVHEIDDTGARMLYQIIRRLKNRGIETRLSYICRDNSCMDRQKPLHRAGIARVCPEDHWHEDTDHALEAIEDEILAEHDKESIREIAFSEMSICHGLSTSETTTLEKYFDALPSYEEGHSLFEQGEPAETLFILRSGSVKLRTQAHDGSSKRVAELNPGAIFGSDMLHPHRGCRVATATARLRSSCWAMSRCSLDRLETAHPHLALRIYRAAATAFSERIAALALEAAMVDA